MIVIKYILPSVLIFLGLLSIKAALKKQTQQEKIFAKNNVPTFGKGGRIHLFYIGAVLIILALFLFYRKWP